MNYSFYSSNKDRIWRSIALLLISLSCLYVSLVQVAGVDFWLQAKVGEWIHVHNEIPKTLLFPFTEVADQRFNAHEWLTSLLFYQLLHGLGQTALPVFTALLGLLLFFLAFRMAYQRSGGNTVIGVIGGILVIAGENYRHVLRPELIALLIFAVHWLLLERIRSRPNWLNILFTTILVIIWANSHGSFILGPIMSSIYAMGLYLNHLRIQRSLTPPPTVTLWFAALSGLSLLACLVNPFGTELITFVVGFSNDPLLREMITEWAPTLSSKWLMEPGWYIAVFLWTATLLTMAIRRKFIDSVDLLIFLFFTILAIKAIRFPVYLGFVSCYIFSKAFPSSIWNSNWHTAAWKSLSAFALLVLGFVIRYGNAYGASPYSYGPYRLGPDVVTALENPIYSGNVITSMSLGCELIYHAYPRLKPSMDCRVDSYGLDYYRYQLTLLSSTELMNEFVSRYDVRYMLYDRANLSNAFQRGTWIGGDWKIIAADHRNVFLEYVGHH